MSHCCVPGCLQSKSGATVLHSFPNPAKFPDLFRSWVNAVFGTILESDHEYIHKKQRVCRRHFDEKYLCRFNKLTKTAVPTLYLPEKPVRSNDIKIEIDTDNIENDDNETYQAENEAIKCEPPEERFKVTIEDKIEVDIHNVEYNINHDNVTNEADNVDIKCEPPEEEFEETIEEKIDIDIHNVEYNINHDNAAESVDIKCEPPDNKFEVSEKSLINNDNKIEIDIDTNNVEYNINEDNQTHEVESVFIKCEPEDGLEGQSAGSSEMFHTCPCQSTDSNQRKRKSNAERQRDYRQRQKNKSVPKEKKKKTETQRKSSAERQKAYRQRVKNIPEKSKILTEAQRKLSAERQRKYRQRQKNKNIPEEKKIQSETQKITEKLSQESQLSLSHSHIPVETAAGTSGTIQNVPNSSEESKRKSKSNVERQKEYSQRQKNIPEEMERKNETQKLTEKLFQESQRCISHRHIPVDPLAETSGTIQNDPTSSQGWHYCEKLRDRAYSKAYRHRKKIKKFLNMESEIQSRKSVDLVAGTSGTIQNVPDSSKEWQRHIKIEAVAMIHDTSTPIANKNKAKPKDEIVPFDSQSVQQNNQVCQEQNIQVSNETSEFELEGGVDIGFEEKSSDYKLIEANTLRSPNKNDNRQMENQAETIMNKYKLYDKHVAARVLFHQKFTLNPFGHACNICDRLWFKNDLKLVKDGFQDLFRQIIENYQDGSAVSVCTTCHLSIKKNKIPSLSKYSGFKYPDVPTHLPKLGTISERLISPRLPFMQIKRLRHYDQPGQYEVYGQIINVPVELNNMVRDLPRLDEHSVYINFQTNLIQKNLRGLVNKQDLKAWLRFLVDTPLYKTYSISIDETFFNDVETQAYNDLDDVSEHIPVEETLTAQQQTLLFDEDKLLRIAGGEGNSSFSMLFDEHAEELSFPAIYLGQFRQYKVIVTPFMQATSELRRADRRGATPNHILYLAMKIMRLRVRDSLVALKNTNRSDSITKEQIMNTDYINTSIESNLALLKSIPNSTWYWSDRKRDLFAMIRQLGKPTAFMSLSANEIKWVPLLKILHKLKNNCEVSTEAIEQLDLMERSDLVNEDPVTCAIYFNKLVNVLMSILMSKRNSPFEKYYVIHYFKRIEFQDTTPYAHILLWLNNAPNDVLDKNYNEAIKMIDTLSSVSASEASGNIILNTHKHTDTCPKKITKCRFEAPFMPIKQTLILSPIDKDEENYSTFRKQYASIRNNLESCSFTEFDDFYNQNNITSDQQYYDIIRAGINRPSVFIKRLPKETWHIPFNPFVFNLLPSNMDLQFILDEYSCAQFVDEYVNKTDKGISDLRKKIIQVMDEHPEFDIVEITNNMSIDMLNTVEMSAQEAAWYLLREPLSKFSTAIINIPTVPPLERQSIRKTMEELAKLDNESTHIWKENLFDKYEKRPESLNDVSLAQFASKYFKQFKTGQYVQRKDPKIIRYRNYDMTENFNEYRREMVTLYIPFKNEQEDILLDSKYINTYEENKDIIKEKRKEFESDFDIEKTVRICRQLCRDHS